jgi:hypothetical protein
MCSNCNIDLIIESNNDGLYCHNKDLTIEFYISKDEIDVELRLKIGL